MDGPGSGSGGVGAVADVLVHYGIKGMKWGVRRKNPTPTTAATTTTPGRKVKATGGTGQKASSDAVEAARLRQIAKKSTTDSLSNKELQALVQRLNLERQYDSLRPRSTGEQAKKFVTDLLVSVGKEESSKYARSQISGQISEVLKKN